MPLTLITGPAHAAKAGALLDRYSEVIDQAPILVVPTFADVDFYQRDLARRGEVFGTDVRTFQNLSREIAHRSGVRLRPIGTQARERVAARAIARSDLQRLAPSAGSAGFPRHFLRLARELEQERISPARLLQALRDWGEGGEYATEVARLYSAYRAELDRLGRPDADLAAVAALDALREDPSRWGTTPVLFYGFDQLDPMQFDTIETLARQVDADVWFALTYEAGRDAMAARSTTFQDLRALGAQHRELPAEEHYYAAPVLYAIERGLMQAGAAKAEPGGAVQLLEGGGERAEVELVAQRVKVLLEAGTAPHEIAVVHRNLDATAALIDDVFSGYGVPIALSRTYEAGHTALGRGIVAALRCALGDGDAETFVDYLRTPGLIANQGRVDALEREIRVEGIRDVADARTAWAQQHGSSDALDWLARDARRGTEFLIDQLETQIAYLLTRGHQRRAAIFGADAMVDARTAAALNGALREFRRLPAQLAPDPAEMPAVLAAVEVFAGVSPGTGLVTVTTPQAIRARQVRALFCMGLTQGSFPKPVAPLPFFDDSERRSINVATRLGLRLRDDALQTERFFFYMACSRPTDVLGLSWASADDDGKPQVRSLFVDDLLDVLTEAPPVQRRDLGAVGWNAEAPTPREAQRGQLAASKGAPEPGIAGLSGSALSESRERDTWSATALETWIGCPVRWLAEKRLNLKNMEPAPEPMLRGQLTHRVLEQIFKDLDGPLTEADLPRIRPVFDQVLADARRDIRTSVDPDRLAAEARRTEADLIAYIEHAAANGSTFSPEKVEVRFGFDDDEPSEQPLVLSDGVNKLRGVIDRIDEGPGNTAIIWDYKGRATPPAQADWGAPPHGKGKIQIALYMLAAERVMNYKAVGGLYQPLNARRDARPRGLMIADEDESLDLVSNDRVDEEAARELLARCEADALKAIAELREGLVQGRPGTCGWKDGACEHPSICRHEKSDL